MPPQLFRRRSPDSNFFESVWFHLIGSLAVLLLSAGIVGLIGVVIFSLFKFDLSIKLIIISVLFLVVGGINVRLITLH